MLALQAITPLQLAAAIPAITLGEARKLIAQVHRDEPVHATSAIRRVAVEAVRAAAHQPILELVSETPSQRDPFVKYLLGSAGARFETVRIPLEHPDRFTVCVSSQVGCALGCAFCATGRLGLSRNLAAWEIVEQVRVVRARLPRGRVHGVVFQGMGEPLANLDEVLASIAVLTDPCALGIDARAITVCTAGLPIGIRRLAREAPKVRLGLSIHTAVAERRRSLMPIARAHSLDEVLAAAAEHARTTGLAPMWAITLLAGINDSDDDARAIAALARTFADDTGVRPRLSIIAYNAIDDDHPFASPVARGAGGRAPPDRLGEPFERSPREQAFRAALGLPSHRRYSGGGDVGAACGQLAARS